jgi:hypothetical protein
VGTPEEVDDAIGSLSQASILDVARLGQARDGVSTSPGHRRHAAGLTMRAPFTGPSARLRPKRAAPMRPSRYLCNSAENVRFKQRSVKLVRE